LDEAIAEAKGKVESTDKDQLEAAGKALSEKIMPIGAKMYEAASKDAEPKAESEKPKADGGKEDVVEGEVVEEDPSTGSGPAKKDDDPSTGSGQAKEDDSKKEEK
jgi:hypothetical protein